MSWIIAIAALFVFFLWAKLNSKKPVEKRRQQSSQRQPIAANRNSLKTSAPVSPGEENRRRVAAILATRQSLTSAPYSKSDIDELTSVAIDQVGGIGQNHKIVSSRDVAIPASPNAKTPHPQGWIPPGQSVVIAGLNVPGGMIYVGRSLNPTNFTNCLINPSLSVASVGDHSGAHMGYWPSYSAILPQERRAFLEWLSGGRQAPNAYIGYVFLFFYGLERRMFIDEAVEERPAIEGEVRRLLALYGSNGSFRGYAARFLDTLSLLNLNGQKVPEPIIDSYGGYELPNAVKLHIGSKIADKAPLDADDALLWVLNAPDTYLRTAATRCFSEFKTLWKILFEQAYPTGMQVSAPKARLNISYQAAMGFSASVKVLKSGELVPDISNLSAPLEKLRAIVTQCTDALDVDCHLKLTLESHREVTHL